MFKKIGILGILTLSLLLPQVLMADTKIVPDFYSTIQSAIDAAVDGDTILIQANDTIYKFYGRCYPEQIVVNKSLNIFGGSFIGLESGVIISVTADSCHLEGMLVTNVSPNTGDMIRVTGNNCHLENITIMNGGGNTIESGAWDAGLKLDGADSCLIENCSIKCNEAAGLAMTGSSNCMITNCAIINNEAGIYLYTTDEGGEPFANNANNYIYDNDFIYNHDAGIKFAQGPGQHIDNTIENNYFVYNVHGIYINSAQSNIIIDNCIFNSVQYGLYDYEGLGEGGLNDIHNNSLIYNYGGGVQGYCYVADPGSADLWHENFWSDYAGEDNNFDGVGDTPYMLDGGISADSTPLMNAGDFDSDGVSDAIDNCPAHSNENQADSDQDGIGNVCEFHCGDADYSLTVNILDLTYAIRYLYKGGPKPIIDRIFDVNWDGATNILDCTYLINYFYKSGPDPNCPLY